MQIFTNIIIQAIRENREVIVNVSRRQYERTQEKKAAFCERTATEAETWADDSVSPSGGQWHRRSHGQNSADNTDAVLQMVSEPLCVYNTPIHDQLLV